MKGYIMMNKSLISVRGRFLFFLVITLTALIIISGCSNDDDENIVNPPQDNAFKLTGTINNYPGGSTIARARLFGDNDSYYDVGTDTIENSGSLNMDLSTPPINFLLQAKEISNSSNIVVSDTTASYAGFTIVNVYNFSNIQIASIYNSNSNLDSSYTEGSFIVQYIFATKPFTITGADTITTGSATTPDTTIYKYNLNLREGWNIIKFKLTISRNNYDLYDLIMGEPSDGSWYYQTVSSTKVNSNSLISKGRKTILEK
ncbi:MAG: hypothetical protein STSR0008_04710 [Ignavibacterium sp.]